MRRAWPWLGKFSRGRACAQAIDAVVRLANRTLLPVSEGERAGDEAVP